MNADILTSQYANSGPRQPKNKDEALNQNLSSATRGPTENAASPYAPRDGDCWCTARYGGEAGL